MQRERDREMEREMSKREGEREETERVGDESERQSILRHSVNCVTLALLLVMVWGSAIVLP